MSPLHYASGEGHIHIVKYLVEMGADINLKSAGEYFDFPN